MKLTKKDTFKIIFDKFSAIKDVFDITNLE